MTDPIEALKAFAEGKNRLTIEELHAAALESGVPGQAAYYDVYVAIIPLLVKHALEGAPAMLDGENKMVGADAGQLMSVCSAAIGGAIAAAVRFVRVATEKDPDKQASRKEFVGHVISGVLGFTPEIMFGTSDDRSRAYIAKALADAIEALHRGDADV